MDIITNPQTQSTFPSASVRSVDNNPIEIQDDNQRVLGRQIPSGNIRGNQTITGSLIVNNPSTNTTSITLSGEDQTITVTDPTTKINRILFGKLPDGTFGIAISKEGINVNDAFS